MKLKYIALLILSVFIVSCSSDDKEEISSKRTVLAYMVSSNLGSALTANIDRMISVANAKNLNGGNLIVYYSWYDKEAKESKAELFQIKEGKGGVVTKHHIHDYQGQNAASPQVMRSVIQDVFAQFPAEGYGLLLSSHGTSWMPSAETGLRSFGDENGKQMEIYELADALKGFYLDFIAFDACSMGGVECVYELKDVTDYILSSPSEIMRIGFPYEEVLPCFFANKPDLEKASKSFYDFFLTYENPYGNISVTNTRELAALASITKEIITTAGLDAMYALPLNDIQTLSYLSGKSTRLYDFEDVLTRLATDDQKKRLKDCLDKVVVSKYATKNMYSTHIYGGIIPVNQFSGLSIYPIQPKLTQLNNWYKTNLSWYKAVYP